MRIRGLRNTRDEMDGGWWLRWMDERNDKNKHNDKARRLHRVGSPMEMEHRTVIVDISCESPAREVDGGSSCYKRWT